MELLVAGRKIEAIRVLRETTGTGLKEAKECVERFEAELRANEPERFTHAPARSGCATRASAIVITAIAAYVAYRCGV